MKQRVERHVLDSVMQLTIVTGKDIPHTITLSKYYTKTVFSGIIVDSHGVYRLLGIATVSLGSPDDVIFR